MSLPAAEVAADFRDALQDLRMNSRPEISNLTLIAKENTEYAQAISTELEQHIKSTRPEFKLPALYVLDSIVKNVGTPYTVYLGRNMYRTFMDAYLVMDQGTRKAMEGLLRTWKQPVPESLDNRPVFPADVTQDIENALAKMRNAIQQQVQRPAHALPARPPTTVAWRDTATPPQNMARYAAPNDPRARPYGPPMHGNGPPVHYQSPQQQSAPMSSNDLADLKAEIAQLISTTQARFATNFNDPSLRKTLEALLGLKHILDTQTLPPQQLDAVPPAPAPTGTPTANLAALLAQFSKPGATPPVSQATPVQSTPVPQLPPQPPAASAALGSADWLLKALSSGQGLPFNLNGGPMAAQPMSRQTSAPTNVLDQIELTTASMKKPRFHLISRLYEAKPNICATCGRRFDATAEGKEKKARHMDWHFKVKDPDANKRGVHRSWYIGEKEWIDYREVDETAPPHESTAAAAANKPKKQAKDRYISVPQDPVLQQAPCPICQEKFETQWNVDANDFVWMDALQVGGKVYHATCFEEYSKGAGIPMPGTPDSVLGKRKADLGGELEGKKIRAF
ncbi:hypothetical protein SNOG_01300 [Parastagonospora nodorum SN15]|uniref:CID domain-containing protein n=1 Tax=Phaeosphaeria nodorum (strain SN15 / ATCC MYA-4574 / FGSC 10173) TaxID=321614 RepID=Q0V3W4_PHANO|nr:hypothetical protein SNOG_01300 [Parastagonospora nodorum SN15]EAT90949.2 hypothetical protein SNOG_01300 [Parastagonospora nodorum SN15]